MQINPAGEVTRIYSDAFEQPGEGAVLIGEGNGDRYAHAQSRYLAKDIRDEYGRANYRWTGEALEEIPEAEKPAAPPRPERAGDIAGDGGYAGHFRAGRVRKQAGELFKSSPTHKLSDGILAHSEEWKKSRTSKILRQGV